MWRFTKNNGITEGLHNKMEMLSRRAFGFRNFENYRMRGVFVRTRGISSCVRILLRNEILTKGNCPCPWITLSILCPESSLKMPVEVWRRLRFKGRFLELWFRSVHAVRVSLYASSRPCGEDSSTRASEIV
jgi:hypothetical protein